MRQFFREFLVFGLKQLRACVFAGLFFGLLFLSLHLPLGPLPRYDFLFLAAVAIQFILYRTGIETKEEVRIIALYHLIGFVLEIYKTNPQIGSWSYPEFGYLKIAGVPLYSGFMYAAIGSYMSQAWKIFKLELDGHFSYRGSIVLCALIYLNFFTHHFLPDFRWVLSAAVVAVFWKVRACYTVVLQRRAMPLVVSFVLIAFFIWIAENIGTFLGAWRYPNQVAGWTIVHPGKISSWTLLAIISFLLIAYLKHYKTFARNGVDNLQYG